MLITPVAIGGTSGKSLISGSHSGRTGKFGTPAQVIGAGAKSTLSNWRDLFSGNVGQKDLLDLRDGSIRERGAHSVSLPSSKPLSSPTAPVSTGAIAAPSSATELQRVWDYADLAKAYGMSNETAYQEALSNTSYQRAVKDMQAAGLNPAALFGAGRVSGADGVNYVSGQYSYSGDSSGAYSSSKSYSSAKSSYAIKNGTYNVIKLAAGVAGAAIMHKTPYLGYLLASNVATGVLRAYNGLAQGK